MDLNTERALEAWRAVVVAHDSLMAHLTGSLKEDGLTVPQYDVLLRLIRSPDNRVSMGELARTLLYSSGAATKVVDRLVAMDLVERGRSAQDARVIEVVLTPHGKDVARAAGRRHAAEVAELVGDFASDEERAHVLEFLQRIARRAGSPHV